MKKIINTIFVVGLLSIVFVACSGDSYQKRLDKEKKAVKNLLADSGITVLHEYPKDHVFGEKEYYLEPGTGVYLRVINPGNLETAMTDTEKPWVTLRFDSVQYMVSNYFAAGNNWSTVNPITFQYNNTNTYYGTSMSVSDYTYMYMSAALVLPLKKGVGSGAEVSMIVPFINGSSYQQAYYEPYYFPQVVYRWYKQESTEDTSTTANN